MTDQNEGPVEWVGHPATHSMIAPLRVATDPSLSARAKGVMLYLLTLGPSESKSAEALLPHFREGRDAIRAALAELAAAGYISTRRERDGGGRWTTRTVISPYGPQSPWPENPSTVFPSAVSPSAEIPSTESQAISSSTSNEVDAAATFNSVGQVGGAADLDVAPERDEDARTRAVTASHIPWTEVHLLRSWFGVEDAAAVEAWTQAWATGMAVASEGFDVQTHLVGYLTRCHEERRPVKPSLWLRFLIEDRSQHLAVMREQEDRLRLQGAADGGEQWALRSLRNTPNWDITEGKA